MLCFQTLPVVREGAKDERKLNETKICKGMIILNSWWKLCGDGKWWIGYGAAENSRLNHVSEALLAQATLHCVVSFHFCPAFTMSDSDFTAWVQVHVFFSNLYCCHFSSFFSVKQSRWNLWSVWGFVLWGRQCSTGQETEIDEIDWWVWLQLQCYNSDFKFCCHKFFAFNDMQHHIDDGLWKHSHWRSFPMTS